MKRLAFFLTGVMGLYLNSAFAGTIAEQPQPSNANAVAADQPRGSLLELHSCEVFAGGCVVASEAMQGGRYMLRVWDFNGGSFQGRSLAGLQLAIVQLSPDNLASRDARSGDAVVYLPSGATGAQRDALLAWLKSSQPDFQPNQLMTRIAPLHFSKNAQGYSFTAGEFVAVRTNPFARCDNFTCGESLWYEPRSETSVFTVAVDQTSQVNEPMLQLKWSDDGKRNVFLARFGESKANANVFVTMAELCGGTRTVF